MDLEIKMWSQNEAEGNFRRIELDEGEGEWYDIEFKEKLCFDDTIAHNNTTQRAISGFANTCNAYLIVGFDKHGKLIGVEPKSNIENELQQKLSVKLSPVVPIFKAKYYKYKSKSILVIFVQKSLKPIRCDNGVYYYREQSKFSQMTHAMLDDRFRINYEEEKYIQLVTIELSGLVSYLTLIMQKANELNKFKIFKNKQIYTLKIDKHLKIADIASEKLYHFLVRTNLLEKYSEYILYIRSMTVLEGHSSYELNMLSDIIYQTRSILRSIQQARAN